MDNPNYAQSLNTHYAPQTDLTTPILAAIRAAGKDPDSLTYDDLAPLDQFHSRGRAATVDLAQLAHIQPGHIILDIGGGLGGPARLLASEYNCHVTVLDLTEQYIQAGQVLTSLTGLAGRVTHHHGDALDLPFPDHAFDVVWTQHSSMNIPDKPRLYAEIHRVLKPGGTLAIHEVTAGPTQPVLYPVPWASTPEISFLLPAPDLRSLLTSSGFHELHWLDLTATTILWLRERQAATSNSASNSASNPTSQVPPLSLGVLLGTRTPEVFANLARNLQEHRLTIIMATFKNT